MKEIEEISDNGDRIRVAKVFDNGGKTMDRYSATFDLFSKEENDWDFYPGDVIGTIACVHISDDTSPRGVSMWVNCYPDSDLGKEITFNELPENVKNEVIAWMKM